MGVSHSLLDFELIKLPTSLPEKKLLSAARLEAVRIYNLFKNDQELPIFAFWPKSSNEVLVFALEASKISWFESQIPSNILICGLFPAWVALWAFLLDKKARLDDGLYFVRTPIAFEGFWVRDGRPVGIMPSSLGIGEVFLKHFEGEIFEVAGDPEEVLLKGAYLVPSKLADEKIPIFDGYPLRIRPKINVKIFWLWILPILILTGGIKVEALKKKVAQELVKVDKDLVNAKQKYIEIEALRKAQEEEKKLTEALKPYLSGNRPHLLDILLEITEIFPQSAWIRRFEFRSPDEIRLWGECENALALLEGLSISERFKEARFLSTVTKNPTTGRERFSMVLKLNLKFDKK